MLKFLEKKPSLITFQTFDVVFEARALQSEQDLGLQLSLNLIVFIFFRPVFCESCNSQNQMK
jgi:hypothetical protein